MMSSLGAELQKAPSLQHTRHQLQRTISDVHILPKHSPFNHHHHHHHHYHHIQRERGEKEEKTAVSNLSASFIYDGTKSEGVTPNVSRSGSRRTSVFISADDNSAMSGRQRERKAVKPGAVKAEREKNALRANELRKTLSDLNTFSNTTTNRLDDTYYSVLEKVNALKSTISSLKELAELTRKLNEDFKKDSSEVVTDAISQLDAFDDFQVQEQKILQLEKRIVAGRERAETLGLRVQAVKQRIERWEKVEGEWQQRTRKTLRVLWSVTAVTFLVVLGLVAFQYTPARSLGPGVLHGFNISNFTGNVADMGNELGNETLRLKRSAIDALERLQKPPKEEIEEDPRLRAFDEL